MKKLKNRKWYSTLRTKPDRKDSLIVMTDMGYVFEAIFENGVFLTSRARDGKVYFETYEHQESLVRFMKI